MLFVTKKTAWMRSVWSEDETCHLQNIKLEHPIPTSEAHFVNAV